MNATVDSRELLERIDGSLTRALTALDRARTAAAALHQDELDEDLLDQAAALSRMQVRLLGWPACHCRMRQAVKRKAFWNSRFRDNSPHATLTRNLELSDRHLTELLADARTLDTCDRTDLRSFGSDLAKLCAEIGGALAEANRTEPDKAAPAGKRNIDACIKCSTPLRAPTSDGMCRTCRKENKPFTMVDRLAIA